MNEQKNLIELSGFFLACLLIDPFERKSLFFGEE
jgi:hypothetical protein